ncbi:YhgE/Pip family protein, partial [Escherichia coli]|nr:YhgE/Pip family protein [Escherichia coli]
MLTRFIRLVQFEFRRFKGRSKLGLIFILVIPLLYGGIYLHANWDLYSNTDKIKIAVVSHDRPAMFSGRTVNGGQEFQDTLKKNPRFDWQFLGTDEDRAYQGLRDAEYFM